MKGARAEMQISSVPTSAICKPVMLTLNYLEQLAMHAGTGMSQMTDAVFFLFFFLKAMLCSFVNKLLI